MALSVLAYYLRSLLPLNTLLDHHFSFSMVPRPGIEPGTPSKVSTIREGFVKTIQISNLIRDNFYVINLCQRYPSFDLNELDIPRGISADDKLLRDNKVSILTTPRSNTLPVTVTSSSGTHTIHQIKEYTP